MADDDERPGGPRAQVPGQPTDHLDVEMVGGLVEHQHVVPGQQDPASATRRRSPPDRPTTRVEFDPGQQVLDDGAGVGFGRPDVVGPAAVDLPSLSTTRERWLRPRSRRPGADIPPTGPTCA